MINTEDSLNIYSCVKLNQSESKHEYWRWDNDERSTDSNTKNTLKSIVLELPPIHNCTTPTSLSDGITKNDSFNWSINQASEQDIQLEVEATTEIHFPNPTNSCYLCFDGLTTEEDFDEQFNLVLEVFSKKLINEVIEQIAEEVNQERMPAHEEAIEQYIEKLIKQIPDKMKNPRLNFTKLPQKRKRSNSEASNSPKPPKMEYIREKLYRGFQTSNEKGEFHLNMIAGPNFPKSELEKAYEEEYIETRNANYEEIEPFIDINSLPVTERKKKRSNTGTNSWGSFNNDFFNHVFSSKNMHKVWCAYIKAVFVNKSCRQLCDGFSFDCGCIDKDIKPACIKWEKLEIYSYKQMIIKKKK